MALSRNAKRILAGAVAVAAFALVLGFLRFKRFVDEDPRLCATCHRSSPEFALWLGGTHKSVACQRCHHSTPRQGVAMLGAFVAGKKPAAQHADVEVGSCASCHLSHDPRWPQVGGSRGHRIHVEEKKISCVRCHAASMHGFEPVAAKCVSCHPGHAVNVEKMQALHCFACHEFLTTEPGLRPTRRDCMRCHTAEGINAPPMKEHGAPMEMSCARCHRPHAKEGGILAACTECHTRGRMVKGGLHATRGHERCVDCHRPHTWTPEPDACLRCHVGGKAGHPAEATARPAPPLPSRLPTGQPHPSARAPAADSGGCWAAACHAFRGAPLPPLPVTVW